MTRLNNLYYFSFVILLIFSSLLLQSCYKFSGSQTIPSYIKIDSVYLETTYAHEGSSSQKITDVWVYLNKNLVGVFELPALFPVLANGINDLEIRPGIWLNGIQSTRVPYPFYKPVVYEEFNFYPDSIHDIGNLKMTYHDNVEFPWLEDFEQSGITLVNTSVSDTTIMQTEPVNNPEAFISPNSKYSGVIDLTNEKPIYSAASSNSFQKPNVQNDPVVLELNYKSDNLFHVGLLLNLDSGIKKVPLLIMNHSDEWNKIYINLGPNIALYHTNITNYKVYFESGLELDKETAKMYLDNIKLVNRPTS